MDQFDDVSQISVEDFDIKFTQNNSFELASEEEEEKHEDKNFKNQQYLDQKLSLDVYRIPILYLKWFLDTDHQG